MGVQSPRNMQCKNEHVWGNIGLLTVKPAELGKDIDSASCPQKAK